MMWSGAGLALLAVLVLLVSDSTGSLRFAVTLVVFAIALITGSLMMRPSADSMRVDIEDRMFDEMDQLRAQIHEEVVSVGHDGHRMLNDKVHHLAETVTHLRGQVDHLHTAAIAAASAPAVARSSHPASSSIVRHTETVHVTRHTMMVDADETTGTVYGSRSVSGSDRQPSPHRSVRGRRGDVPRDAAFGDADYPATEFDGRNATPAAFEQDGYPMGGYPADARARRGPAPGGHEAAPQPHVAYDSYGEDGYGADPFSADPYAAGPYQGDPYGSRQRAEQPSTVDHYGVDPQAHDGYDRQPHHRGQDSTQRRAEPRHEPVWPDEPRLGGADHFVAQRGADPELDESRYPEPRHPESQSVEPLSPARRSDDHRELGVGDRWAAVRADEHGREVRMGERRSSIRRDEHGTEVRVEDRWASVRQEEPRDAASGRGFGPEEWEATFRSLGRQDRAIAAAAAPVEVAGATHPRRQRFDVEPVGDGASGRDSGPGWDDHRGREPERGWVDGHGWPADRGWDSDRRQEPDRGQASDRGRDPDRGDAVPSQQFPDSLPSRRSRDHRRDREAEHGYPVAPTQRSGYPDGYGR